MRNPVTVVGFSDQFGNTQTSLPSGKQYGPPVDTIVTDNATTVEIAAGGMAFVQNLDDAAVYVKLGAAASDSNFSFVLSAGTAANDGLGGSREITNYFGLVSFAAAAASPRLIFSNFS